MTVRALASADASSSRYSMCMAAVMPSLRSAAVATAQAKQQSEAIAALIEERDKLAMELQVRLVNA